MSTYSDHRELVAQALYTAIVEERIGHLFPLRDPANLPSPHEYVQQQMAICQTAADAVLAALKPWLLPLVAMNANTIYRDQHDDELLAIFHAANKGAPLASLVGDPLLPGIRAVRAALTAQPSTALSREASK